MLVIELGAGTAIPSVREFSHYMSKTLGALIIRINPVEYDVSSPNDVGIKAGALEALQRLNLIVRGESEGPNERYDFV